MGFCSHYWNDPTKKKVPSPKTLGCFQKIGIPQIIHFNRVFHYKPTILGYPYFWKHPLFVEFLLWERDSVWCWSRNWTAWKLIFGFLIKRSQKKSLPDLADILGQPQEDLAVSFNEMCQYCSCQPRFPTLFAVTWREAASENLCGSVKMMLKRKPMMLRCS